MVGALETISPSFPVGESLAMRAVSSIKNIKNKREIETAAKEFEAMFMAQMLQPMWEGIEVNELFGGGHGEEMMRVFLIQELGKSIAQGMDTGIFDAVKTEMIRLQEAQSAEVKS